MKMIIIEMIVYIRDGQQVNHRTISVDHYYFGEFYMFTSLWQIIIVQIDRQQFLSQKVDLKNKLATPDIYNIIL